jgi:Protein of unknown function (DUF3455)
VKELTMSPRPKPPRIQPLPAALLPALLLGCAMPPPAAVPSALMPAPGHRDFATIAARGVQIYECRSSANSAGFSWTFVAPDAELFDQRGRRIGSHGAGPHWQSDDGSRITGKPLASAPAPTPGAIAWLLLSTRSAGPAGALSSVTHIQRVNTQGGVAPAAPCTPQRIGESARVAYSADYRLFSTH